MKASVYAPLIAAAALVGTGIYAVTAYQRHQAEVAAIDTGAPTAKIATATTPARPAHKVAKAPVNPRSKMASLQPQTASRLAAGQLVKLTGVVDSASARSLVVERSGKPVTVQMNNAEAYSNVSSQVDRTTVGKMVTVYGRVRDANGAKPVVDADAVYQPQSRRLLFSNGQNQTMKGDIGEQTRVRFTANYRSM